MKDKVCMICHKIKQIKSGEYVCEDCYKDYDKFVEEKNNE